MNISLRDLVQKTTPREVGCIAIGTKEGRKRGEINKKVASAGEWNRSQAGGETTEREMSLVPPGRQGGLGHEAKKEVLYYIFERSRGCGEGLETCHQLCGTLTTSFSRIPERGRPPRLVYWG